jgi:hypothetical protein
VLLFLIYGVGVAGYVLDEDFKAAIADNIGQALTLAFPLSFFNIQVLRYTFVFVMGVCVRDSAASAHRDRYR